MNSDLIRAIDGRPFLCDPGALRLALATIAAHKTCPSPRELAKCRRKRLRAIGDASRTTDAVPDSCLRRMAQPKTGGRMAGMTGVICIQGPIQQRLSAGMLKAGGTALEEVNAALDLCMADPQITGVLMQFDSGGGESYGVLETGQRIADATKKKPVNGAIDSLCASAAYWLASACSNLAITPSGDVGSVGVFITHIDQSRQLENEGVVITTVASDPKKVELAPWQSLTPDARAYLQAMVDDTYAQFTSAVARNRGTTVANVKATYGSGRLLGANAALRAGLVDRVAPFDAVLGSMTSGKPMQQPRRSALSTEQQRLAAKVERDAERLRVRAKLDHADEVLAQAEARHRERMERFGRM